MITLDEIIKNNYESFKGLPNGAPIVRLNIENDAFALAVLKIMYREQIENLDTADATTLAKYVVAPPDNGIDIVIERTDIEADERYFDFIQVKNSELSPIEIKQAFAYMKQTISEYLKNPSLITRNLKKVLADFEFAKDDKANCSYYVVHRGVVKNYKGIDAKKETVITGSDLENYINVDIDNPRVSKEEFTSDQFNNFITYEEAADTPAILMNISGYSLARLAEKYDNTALGRNILFGQNFREGLVVSATYDGMAETIRNEPDKFWFYNNGITILVSDYDTYTDDKKKVEKLVLKDFSIINGAQTTSSLGKFYTEAKLNQIPGEVSTDIENLKKVFVLARILKVNDERLTRLIARFNNTQNPITSRDMVSTNPEQLKLHDRLKGDNPAIYMNIRRGMKKPSNIYFAKHRCITNEVLAQLSFAGFYRDPSAAKNQKKSLFDYDPKQSEFTVNESYHKIFDEKEGILYSKTNEEIDELLFVYELYNKSKTYLKRKYQDRIDELENGSYSEEEKKSYRLNFEKRQAIGRKCTFFCLAYYYSLKSMYPLADKDMLFRYNDYYGDADFNKKIVSGFSKVILEPTVNLIFDITKSVTSLDDWIRGKRTEDFSAAIRDKFTSDTGIKDTYQSEFVELYKAKKV